jgi:hypothetical protein
MSLDMDLFKVNKKVENTKELNDIIIFHNFKGTSPKTEEVDKDIEKKERVFDKYKGQNIQINQLKHWKEFYFLDSLFEVVYERNNPERSKYGFRTVVKEKDIKEIIEKLEDYDSFKKDVGNTINFFKKLCDDFNFEKETLYYLSSQ